MSSVPIFCFSKNRDLVYILRYIDKEQSLGLDICLTKEENHTSVIIKPEYCRDNLWLMDLFTSVFFSFFQY